MVMRERGNQVAEIIHRLPPPTAAQLTERRSHFLHLEWQGQFHFFTTTSRMPLKKCLKILGTREAAKEDEGV
jgi:hypothetical protein